MMGMETYCEDHLHIKDKRMAYVPTAGPQDVRDKHLRFACPCSALLTIVWAGCTLPQPDAHLAAAFVAQRVDVPCM